MASARRSRPALPGRGLGTGSLRWSCQGEIEVEQGSKYGTGNFIEAGRKLELYTTHGRLMQSIDSIERNLLKKYPVPEEEPVPIVKPEAE